MPAALKLSIALYSVRVVSVGNRQAYSSEVVIEVVVMDAMLPPTVCLQQIRQAPKDSG